MIGTVVSTVHHGILTLLYFFYFLFKGNPEWKCEREREKELEKMRQKICCVDCQPSRDCYEHTKLRSQHHGRGAAATVKDWLSKAWSSVSGVAGSAWRGVKKCCSWVWTKLKSFWNWLSTKLGKVVPFLKTVLFSSIPEQELPPPAYPAGFRPVHFDADERSMSEDLSFKELPPVQQSNPRLPPIPPPRPITPALKVTEVQDECQEGDAGNEHEIREGGVDIPAPPSSPPPPPPLHPNKSGMKSKTPPPNVPPKPSMHVDFHEETIKETSKSYQSGDQEGESTTVSYIQEPNIDLSNYTTKIGGIGPSKRTQSEAANEISTSTNMRTMREGSVGPAIEGGFYAQRTFAEGLEGSIPPPPPPPPPPAMPIKPVKIPSMAGRKTPVSEERKTATSPVGNVKGAVPMLPLSVLEQMSASVETFGERTERGKSATVSERVREANSKTPVPFEGRKTPVALERRIETTDTRNKRESSMPPQVKGWRPVSAFEPERAPYDHSFRAKSVGPTVVSQIENSANDEPQFIFRAKPPTSFITQDGNFDVNGYLMGNSVYRPIPEAERMRDSINRRSMSVSRPVTPAHSLAGSAAPFEVPYANYTNGYTSDDGGLRGRSSRSRTAGPHTRESTGFSDAFHLGGEGLNVNSRIRAWPPPSNTTPMDINKDYWLNGDSTMSYYDRNGDLITTKLKRVSEKTVEDNWKWRDHNGRVIDEKSERSWRGDLDELRNDGPGSGSHFTRTVEMLPGKDIRFQDVNRQYNNNFVVESICRNY